MGQADVPGSKAIRQPREVCVYTRAWRTSGSGLFIQELVLALLDAGVRLRFISPPVDNPELEQPREGLARVRPPREHVGPGGGMLRPLSSLRRIAGAGIGLLAARRSARSYLISIPDPLPFTIAIMALLRLTGARIVLVVHDPLPHAFRLGGRLRRLEVGLHALCYRLATTIVVLSEPTRAKLLAEFPRLRCPVSVIEHGVFPLRDCPPLPGSGLLLLFGTIRRNKRVLEAINGVARARAAGASVRLLIAGEVHREDQGYAAQCRDAAEAAAGAVEFRLGYVTDRELPAVLARCDALLMPYADFHSQSGVALLAASNARPVVASRAGGLTTLLDEGMPATVIEFPVTGESVAAAVQAFFAVPAATWRERAAAYQRLTMGKRSWQVIAAGFIRVIDGLDGTATPGSRPKALE